MATNTSDLKAYWQELAKKANLPEDKAKAVFEALGDEAVEKVFKDGFTKFMRNREQAEINVLKAGLNAASHHMHIFGKPLDVDAVLKTANEKGLTFEAAYKEYIAPELEKKTSSEFETKLKLAREEGARDALSRHKIPVDAGPKEYHPFFDRETDKEKAAVTERDSMAAFVEGWHEAAEKQNK